MADIDATPSVSLHDLAEVLGTAIGDAIPTGMHFLLLVTDGVSVAQTTTLEPANAVTVLRAFLEHARRSAGG